MLKKITIICLVSLIYSFPSFSQSNAEILTSELDKLAKTKEGLNDEIRIDLTGLTLYDYINTLAEEHQLNVSVDSDLNELVTSNFFDVNVKDVLKFLVEKHNLEVKISNGIIVFSKKEQEIERIIKEPLKPVDVDYNPQNDFLSIRLSNDSLPRVARAITDASKNNIILDPSVKGDFVSAYILNRPFPQVIELLAKSNNLLLEIDDDGNYFLSKGFSASTSQTPALQTNRGLSQNRVGLNRSAVLDDRNFEIGINDNGTINVNAYGIGATSLIMAAANELNIDYFMYDVPDNIIATVSSTEISFEELLDNIFKGENFTYVKRNNLYLIGQHTTEGLRTVELIQLENRTIENVLNTMPAVFQKDIEIKEFIELNGFVASGSKKHIEEFKDYIHQIDLIVPVIQIEVIIVQYQKSYEIQTGLQAGLNDGQNSTTGVLFPNSDMQVNATSVNNLIDAFNVFGIINLGKVSEQFYLNLKALENNSLIQVSSTPKLVTLNGHEATSTIGETNYYFEQNNRLINSGIGNDILQSGVWKSTEANLRINIKPFVSKDENVTLSISVEKSSFLGRAGENAPPGKSTQKFESIVRVKNNEMVLLGGLDELEKENSGTGTPFLSRIPLLKWLFSSRLKKREKSKLHLFIKPTVTY